MKFYKYAIVCLIALLIMTYIDVDKEDVYKEYVYASNEIIIDDELDDELVDDVLEIQLGKLSRYGPDCYLCTGYLAYGLYVGSGTIYYNDNYYGNVRILAGDKFYPFGTIVRVSYDMESFLGIVLDRGGSIGFNGKALFDLLYPNEYLANKDGVNYNTKFEILRYGF
ncbi:MAG: hypothetical protein ACI4WP_02930 [Bacilli bacterium]